MICSKTYVPLKRLLKDIDAFNVYMDPSPATTVGSVQHVFETRQA